MGESDIILFRLVKLIGFSLVFSIEFKSLDIIIPFLMIEISFVKKTSKNNWFGFSNDF